jgi:hypothetical protein
VATIHWVQREQKKVNLLLSAQLARSLAVTFQMAGRWPRRTLGKVLQVFDVQVIVDTSFGLRWLYTLFLAMDANYRCGLKDKGLQDIWLAPGWAYFVEQQCYMSHISNYLDQQEVGIQNFLT